MIELNDVSKVFPGMERPAVDQVSFSVQAQPEIDGTKLNHAVDVGKRNPRDVVRGFIQARLTR